MSNGVVGDLKLNLAIEDGQFRVTAINSGKVIAQLRKEMETTGASINKVEKHFDSFGRRLHYFVQGAASVRFLLKDFSDIFLTLPASVAKTAGEFERMQKLMEGLSKSSDSVVRASEAMKSMNYVINMSKSAPFDVHALSDAFVKLKTAGIDPTKGSLEALTNSVAKYGGNGETLKRASVAIQQMSGKGVISLEELRQQLGEAVPNAMQMMALGMGMSMAELSKAVSKGTVSANLAIKKMFAMMEMDSIGASKAMMETFPGALQKLTTDWKLFEREIAGQGFMQAVTEQMRELSAWMSSDAGKQFGRDLGQGLTTAVHYIVALKDTVVSLIPVLKTAGMVWLGVWGGGKLRAEFDTIRAYFGEHKRLIEQEMAIKRQQSIEAANLRLKEAGILQARVREMTLERDQTIAISKQAEAGRLAAVKASVAEEQLIRQAALNRAAAMYAEKASVDAAAAAAQAKLSGGRYLKGEAGAGSFMKAVDKNALRQEIEALTQRSYALKAGAEVELQAAKVTAARTVGLQAETGATRQSIAATQQKIDASRKMIASLEAQSAAMRANAVAVSGVATATRTAMSVVAGFGKTLLGAGIWAAAFAAAAWAIAKGYDLITGAAEKAAAAERKERMERINKGQGDEDSLAKASEDAKKAQTLYEQTMARRAFYEKRYSKMYDSKSDDFKKSKTREQFVSEMVTERGADDAVLKKLKDEARQTKELAERNQSDVKANLIQSQAENLKLYVTSKTEEALVKEKWQERFNKLADEAQNAKTEKERERARKDLTQLRLDAQARKAELTKIYANEAVTANGKVGGLPSVSQEAMSKFRGSVYGESGLLSGIDQTAKDIKAPNEFVIPKGEGTGNAPVDKISGMEKYRERIQSELDQAKSELAVQRGEADAINEERARIIREIEEGIYNGTIYDTRDTVSANGKRKTERVNMFDEDKKTGKKTIKKEYRPWVDESADIALRSDRTKRIQDAEKRSNEDLIALEERVAAGRKATAEGIFEFSIPAVKKLNEEYAKQKEALTKQGSSPAEFSNLDANHKKSIALAQEAAEQEFVARMKEESDQAQVDSEETKQERIVARYNLTTSKIKAEFEERIRIAQAADAEMVGSEDAKAARIVELQQLQTKRLAAEHQRLVQKTKTPMEQMLDGWTNVTGEMQKATANWTDDFMNRMTDALTGGKFKFREFAASILKDWAKIMIRAQFGNMVGSGMSAIGGYMTQITGAMSSSGGGGGASGASATGAATAASANKSTDKASASANRLATSMDGASAAAQNTNQSLVGMVVQGLVNWVSSLFASTAATTTNTTTEVAASTVAADALFYLASAATAAAYAQSAKSMFANGGIMTEFGPLALRKYANGGIATSPQVAIYGEGKTPEAYVPLPDGRTIPVTMQGGGGGQSNIVSINITVNEDGSGTGGESSDSKSGSKGEGNWKQVADKVVAIVRQELVTQQQYGGILAKR